MPPLSFKRFQRRLFKPFSVFRRLASGKTTKPSKREAKLAAAAASRRKSITQARDEETASERPKDSKLPELPSDINSSQTSPLADMFLTDVKTAQRRQDFLSGSNQALKSRENIHVDFASEIPQELLLAPFTPPSVLPTPIVKEIIPETRPETIRPAMGSTKTRNDTLNTAVEPKQGRRNQLNLAPLNPVTVATATAIPDVSDTLPSHVDLDNKVELITTAKEHIPVHLNASGMTKPIINAESHAHIVEPEKPTKAAIANVAEAVDSPSHEATSEEAKTAAVEPKLDFTENPVSSFVAPTEVPLDQSPLKSEALSRFNGSPAQIDINLAESQDIHSPHTPLKPILKRGATTPTSPIYHPRSPVFPSPNRSPLGSPRIPATPEDPAVFSELQEIARKKSSARLARDAADAQEKERARLQLKAEREERVRQYEADREKRKGTKEEAEFATDIAAWRLQREEVIKKTKSEKELAEKARLIANDEAIAKELKRAQVKRSASAGFVDPRIARDEKVMAELWANARGGIEASP